MKNIGQLLEMELEIGIIIIFTFLFGNFAVLSYLRFIPDLGPLIEKLARHFIENV